MLSVITSGRILLKSTVNSDWEDFLSSASHSRLPIRDGDSAFDDSARSQGWIDLLANNGAGVHLQSESNRILDELKSVAGLQPSGIKPSFSVSKNLDFIETGIRQFNRTEPLETIEIGYEGEQITVPHLKEVLRIKALLILQRNATRDYRDFIALLTHMGEAEAAIALNKMDHIYQQDNGESALQQLLVQLANALPCDVMLAKINDSEYPTPQFFDWNSVKSTCALASVSLFKNICDLKT